MDSPIEAQCLQTLSACQELAYKFYDSGRFNDAEKVCEFALQIASISLDAEHPQLIKLYKNLANFQALQINHHGAIANFEKALALEKPVPATQSWILGIVCHSRP